MKILHLQKDRLSRNSNFQEITGSACLWTTASPTFPNLYLGHKMTWFFAGGGNSAQAYQLGGGGGEEPHNQQKQINKTNKKTPNTTTTHTWTPHKKKKPTQKNQKTHETTHYTQKEFKLFFLGKELQSNLSLGVVRLSSIFIVWQASLKGIGQNAQISYL